LLRNVNHKRSTSTLNGLGAQQIEKSLKNEQSLSLAKQFEMKQNYKITENNNNNTNFNNYLNNNKMKFTENDDKKTLFSTFTGSTNFAKELKNSPLKKTHYNIAEINSKYVSKEKNAVNFSNVEVLFNFFFIFIFLLFI